MKVFISYSRKDAEFVNKLKESLEASDIGVIIDVESLKFGDNLQEFVERSVRGADLTIAVISKHSLQSVWVIAEALETLMYEHVEGRKRFLPIYIDTSFLDDTLYLQIVEQIDKDITTLQELTNQAIEKHLGTSLYDQKRKRLVTLRNNLDTIFTKLTNVLVADFSSEEKFAKNLPKLIEAIKRAEKARERYTGRPLTYLAPFQAPPLPQHFVPRPEVTDTLKARLLKDEPTTPGILVVSAIHGLGGIGKSTLAAALAYDKDVQERFPDGILWATLGQQPEILSLISGWIHALRDYDFRPTTVEAASAHLRTLLQDKAILLVVDDVWSPEHAIHFKVGGPRCQVLITTRRADVADEVGAKLHQMDVMTPKQSLELLAARLGKSIWDDTEQVDALRLAEAVGYLPLALELAAVRVTRGMSWTALYEALEQEVANLQALEGAHRRRKGAAKLEASFNLSLNALRADDEKAWNAFVWLGVLPEDVQIAAPMAAILWNIEQVEASELLELLWNDALLLPGSSIIIGEKEWPSYRLHDLLHDIARKLLTTNQPQGLGFTLQQAHATLLEYYKQHTQNGLWHTLPDDGYIHTYLTWHFQQAEQEDLIPALLREETSAGRNGWYQVREQLGQTAGFLADVALALGLAEKGENISLQCRYLLIIASLTSLAANIPHDLMIMLVEENIWTPAQGLAYASQIPDISYRIATLFMLLPHLPETLKQNALRQALLAAQMVEDEEELEVMAVIALHLPQPIQKAVLRQAIGLVPHLPRMVLSLALEGPQVLTDKKFRIIVLPAIETILREMLSSVQTIENEQVLSILLTAIHPSQQQLLEEDILQEVLLTVQAIGDQECRSILLAILVPYFLEQQREDVLQEILTTAQTITAILTRIRILNKIAPYLSEPLKKNTFQEAFITVQAIKEEWKRAQALANLAPHLPVHLLREAFIAVQTLKISTFRVKALAGMAPHLPTPLLQETFKVVQAIEDEQKRAEALTGMAPHLPTPLLQEAFTAVQALEDEEYRAEALVGMVPHLPTPLLREAFTAVQALKNEEYRAKALTGMVPHLPTPLLQEAFTAVQAIEDEKDRSEVLIGMVPHLPALLLQEALIAVQSHRFKGTQVETLKKLTPYLCETLKEKKLREVLAAVQTIGESDENQIAALITLAAYLSNPLRSKALKTIQAFGDGWGVERGVRWLFRQNAFEEALVVIQMIEDPEDKIDVLTKIVPALPPPLWACVFREITVAKLSPYFPKILVWGISIVVELAIKSVWKGLRGLTILFSYLPNSLGQPVMQKVLVAIQKIEDEEIQAIILKTLTFLLPKSLLATVQMIESLLATVQMIEDEWVRAGALVGLIPCLPESSLQKALAIVQAIKDEELWTVVLAAITGLVTYLPESFLHETLTKVQALEDIEEQALGLAMIAPHLAELPSASLFNLWQTLFKNLLHRTREDLLAELGALAPVFRKLGGDELIIELFHAIQDVGRWWP